MDSSASDLGPRRTALLRAWAAYASETESGPLHDFGGNNRYERVTERLDTFLADPTRDSFEALWTREVLRDAVMGGADLVFSTWPGTIDELADQLETMRTATEYDSSWETQFVTKTAVRELYGYMDPAARPILSSSVVAGLDEFGFDRPTSYRDRGGYEAFADAYEAVVGHATAGTEHDVPWHFETEQFLVMLESHDRVEILEELPVPADGPDLTGWHAEGQAGRITFQGVDALVDEYVEARAHGDFERREPEVWEENHWETWKWTHATHVRDHVRDEYDLSTLSAGEVEPFIEAFKRAPNVELSSSVPTYLLGGQSGGILWNEFKTYSIDNAEEAATVLSRLFDTSEPLRDRLTRFNDFYAALDTSGGPRLSLATVLLMFAFPDRYVMYKYGKFNSFFGAYSDHEVSTGFDASQYWILNEACGRLRQTIDEAFALDDRIDVESSMLDIHTLIWVADGFDDL